MSQATRALVVYAVICAAAVLAMAVTTRDWRPTAAVGATLIAAAIVGFGAAAWVAAGPP